AAYGEVAAAGARPRFQDGAVVAGLAQFVGRGKAGDTTAEDDHARAGAAGEVEVGVGRGGEAGRSRGGRGGQPQGAHRGEHGAGATTDSDGPEKASPADRGRQIDCHAVPSLRSGSAWHNSDRSCKHSLMRLPLTING